VPVADEPPLPPGGVLLVADEVCWRPWLPSQLLEVLSGVSVPWYVAGGWALDLWRGGHVREHEDIEIGVPTGEAFAEVRRALAAYEFEVVGSGMSWPLDSPAFALMHQTWVSERGPDRSDGRIDRIYRLDIFREPQRDGQWVCRRDESIVLPYEEVIWHDDAGVPYEAPHLALLFKAKNGREKDDADLAGAVPLLGPGQRAWLAGAIARLHPGHAWLELERL
jgi:hypothetical protein